MSQEKNRITRKHISTTVDNTFGIHDFYYHYRNVKGGTITDKMYKCIIKEFFEELLEYLFQGFLLLMPYGLGDMYVYKYRPSIAINKNGDAYVKGLKAVDYNATNKLWKEHPELKSKTYIYYDNKHTDGYKFKLNKSMFRKGFLNKIYNFKPGSPYNRKFAQVIFNNPYREYLTS